MKIRKAEPKDAKELSALERELFSLENYPLSKASFVYHIKSNLLYVVEEEGTIIAYILTLIRRKKAKLYSLGVLESMRGRGISSALLGAALEKICSLGFKELLLEVRVDNGAALSLYKRFGFITLKRERSFYLDRCDAFIMQKPL